jgi:hypothetical protein
MPTNRAVRWFAAFVCFCIVLTLIVMHLAIGPDPAKASTETGQWAMRLRVVEVMLLAITAGSVLLLIEQLNQTSRWNKRLTYHQFFKELPSAQRVERLRKLAQDKTIDEHAKGEPIAGEKVRLLIDDVACTQIITDYLNDFEEFCSAILRGVVDDRYAYDIEVHASSGHGRFSSPGYLSSARPPHMLTRSRSCKL